jgi:hypothetical protein
MAQRTGRCCRKSYAWRNTARGASRGELIAKSAAFLTLLSDYKAFSPLAGRDRRNDFSKGPGLHLAEKAPGDEGQRSAAPVQRT